MNIISVLERVTEKIMHGEDSVGLTGEEMNVLCDPEQLRAFKIYEDIPHGFKKSSNVAECVAYIRAGDNLYRTLEYCVIVNKALSLVNNYVNFEPANYNAGDVYVN